MTSKREFLKMVGAGAVGAAASHLAFDKKAGRNGLSQNETGAAAEDVSERILKDGVVRVAYIVYPPYFMKDPNTKIFSGIYYDMIMKMAADLGVKVEWVEEVNFSTPFEGFYTGRYDMIGANVWPDGQRVRRADFTQPICYSGMNAYIRPDAARRYTAIAQLNDPAVRIAIIDGEGGELLAKNKCPRARYISLPQGTSNAELVMHLQTGKADATFLEIGFVSRFLARQPGAIVPVTPDPVQVSPNNLSVARHQHSFKAMLNTMVENMLDTGFIADLLVKYQSGSDDFIRVAKPYQSIA
jgi:ABC-type amino acid transport substrate-binding protein